MKKIGIFFLFFFFLINSVSAKEAVFTLGNGKGNKGDEVTLKLTLEDNPAFGLLGVKLDYDENKLEYKDAEIKGLKNAFMKDVDEAKGIVTMYALVLDTKKLMEDTGNILEVTFKILSDKDETSKIEVNVTDFGVDENKTLDYTTKDGYVTIGKGSSSKNKLEEEKDDNKKNEENNEEEHSNIDNSSNQMSDEKDTANEETVEENTKTEKKIISEEKKKFQGKYIFLAVGILGVLGFVTLFVIRKRNTHEEKKNEKKD